MSTDERISRIEEKLNDVIEMANEIATELHKFLGVYVDPETPIPIIKDEPEHIEFIAHKTGQRETT